MKLNLLLLKDARRYTYSLEDSWLRDLKNNISRSDEIKIGESCNYNLYIQRPGGLKSDTFLIEQTLKAKLYLKCSHCLSEFTYDLNDQSSFTAINFTEEDNTPDEEYAFFSNTSDDNQETDFEKQCSDPNLIPLKQFVLDVNKLLKEAIFLNIPYAPLCSDNCKGLCPKCGINKNIETCDCQTDLKNTIFYESLKQLKINGGPNGRTKEKNFNHETR